MTRVTTLGQIASAAALLFVSDATAELNATELKFLTVAAKVCPLVAVVLTKCDLVPAWREIEEHDRRRLDEAGLRQVEILPVSSYLWAYAVTGKDPELSQVSGFPALDEWVDTHVVRHADRLITRSVLVELLFVVDQLEKQFVAEQRSLADPGEAARVGAELEETQVRLRQLREQASRWQMVLNDGVADLNGHIDHDLNDRLRRLGREADETLDSEDPDRYLGHVRAVALQPRRRRGDGEFRRVAYPYRQADRVRRRVVPGGRRHDPAQARRPRARRRARRGRGGRLGRSAPHDAEPAGIHRAARFLRGHPHGRVHGRQGRRHGRRRRRGAHRWAGADRGARQRRRCSHWRWATKPFATSPNVS